MNVPKYESVFEMGVRVERRGPGVFAAVITRPGHQNAVKVFDGPIDAFRALSDTVVESMTRICLGLDESAPDATDRSLQLLISSQESGGA